MSAPTLLLDGSSLTLASIDAFLRDPRTRVALTPEARARVEASRGVVDRAVAEGRTVYGITTGFGRLADRRISASEVAELQRNLIRSHACGTGAPLSAEETRLLMLLRANALAKGFSGVRLSTLEALVAALNAGLLPVIPEKGSVGASGDLAPLAHLALSLMGEGRAVLAGVEMPSADALSKAGLAPVSLEAKEGLSLVNGTQLILSVGARAAIRARRLALQADVIAALSVDALLGTDTAFDPRIHAVRPHAGQGAVARNLRRLLQGSAIRDSHRGPHCKRVQDPYSLRCAPQVHGAARDALAYVEATLALEANAATDNPLVFQPDDAHPEDAVLSGGNFHGAPVSVACDVLAIAACQLGTISERRIERLVNPDYSGLPAFLSRGAVGLHSGFMMAQVTAAALVSENKVLAHPASVDTIPTSAGFEDHVSMGPSAARKAREVVLHVETVLAIEWLAAAQALDLHAPLETSAPLRAAHAALRERVPPLLGDRFLAPDIEAARRLLEEGAALSAAERALGGPLE